MNKLGIFMNFWEKNWDADHAKYIKKVKRLGFDILEFQAQPLLEMTDEKIRNLKKLADDEGIELTYTQNENRRRNAFVGRKLCRLGHAERDYGQQRGVS